MQKQIKVSWYKYNQQMAREADRLGNLYMKCFTNISIDMVNKITSHQQGDINSFNNKQ